MTTPFSTLVENDKLNKCAIIAASPDSFNANRRNFAFTFASFLFHFVRSFVFFFFFFLFFRLVPLRRHAKERLYTPFNALVFIVERCFLPLFRFHFAIIKSDLNQGLEPEPEFHGSISNVTYPAGREAVLTCTVKNLGKYKVRIRCEWRMMRAKRLTATHLLQRHTTPPHTVSI